MEWKIVDEETPGNELVLVSDDEGNIEVGQYEIRHDGPCWRIGNDVYLWDHDFNIGFNVTHWAKLPEPPE